MIATGSTKSYKFSITDELGIMHHLKLSIYLGVFLVDQLPKIVAMAT